MQQYLKISEFARLAGITRKNLIFYDEIGLLSPERVGKNGYRYYSNRQLETASVIGALRDIGMPLAEIKDYLDKRTPAALLELFTLQKERVAQKIQYLQNIQHMIQVRLAITRQAKKVAPACILLTECKEEPLFVSEEITGYSDEIIVDAMNEFYDMCDQEHLIYGYPLGVIISRENLLIGDWKKSSYFFYKIPTPRSNASRISKPKGLYLIGYEEVESYDGPVDVYPRLFSYMEKNELICSGDSYEEFLLDEIAIREPGKFLLQVSVQVERIDHYPD